MMRELTSLGMDAEYRPTASWRMGVEAIRYDETRDRPDATAIDWGQFRLSGRISLLFGTNADRVRLRLQCAAGSAMMPSRRIRLLGLAIPLALRGIRGRGQRPRAVGACFDHAKHTPLFPGSCTTCHLGAASSRGPHLARRYRVAPHAMTVW